MRRITGTVWVIYAGTIHFIASSLATPWSPSCRIATFAGSIFTTLTHRSFGEPVLKRQKCASFV